MHDCPQAPSLTSATAHGRGAVGRAATGMTALVAPARRGLQRRRLVAMMAVLLAFALAAVACGGSNGGGGATQPAEGTTDDQGTLVIRVAMPSEPLWQWLIDSGTLAAWELEHGLRIEASHPFKPFTAFVSGDADIILIDALDIPVFASGFERRPIIIGKYAADRSLAATKRTSQAADLATVVEGKIAMGSQLGSTLLWALIVDAAHGLDLSYDGRDFEHFVATFGIAAAVEAGDAIACLCLPDEGAAGFSAGTLRAMYDGKPASRLYAELSGTPDQLVLGQVFLANRAWLDGYQSAASSFLMLWEQAVQHWHENYADVIREYPELLSLQTDGEAAWLIDYVADNNWIAPSVYATTDDGDAYSAAVMKLQELGAIDADTQAPWVATELRSHTAGR